MHIYIYLLKVRYMISYTLPSEDTSSTDDVTAIAAGNDGKSL